MDFSKIAEYLSHPLVLIGFALFILYSLFKNYIIEKIKILTNKASEKFIFRLLNSFVLIIVLLIILGFGLKYYELNINRKDLSKNVIYKKIEDLGKKKTTFKFNVSHKDSVHLTFNSSKWNFEVNFSIANDYKVNDLKDAIVNHFELDKHIRTKNDEELVLTWQLSSNNILISEEIKSLKDAGLRDNDIVTLSVRSNYIKTEVEKGLDMRIDEKF